MTAAGSMAIAYVGSVIDRTVTDAIVKAAIDTWGRVDMVINNVGISKPGPFTTCPLDTFDSVVDINLRSSWNLTHAAWPYMESRGYGRIIMICSPAVIGQPNLATYIMTRMGLWGLTRSLALEGKASGIHVNAFAPTAYTPGLAAFMCASGQEVRRARVEKYMLPEYMPPVLAWLVHQDCDVTGECIVAAGQFALRFMVSETRGYQQVVGNAEEWSIETVRDHWKEVISAEGQTIRQNTDELVEYLAQSLARVAEGA